MRIFVSIASYRDPFLVDTIKDCYEKANEPNNVFIGIFDQSFSQDKLILESFDYRDNIRYLQIDPVYARGLGFARHVVQTLYDNEEFYLQIDAHTLFEKDWDISLIQQYQELSLYHDKVVITGYPHLYSIDDNTHSVIKSKLDGVLCLVPNNETAFLSENIVTGVSHVINDNTKFKHGFFIAGGFTFAEGSVIEQVPYDPNYYFSCEQESMSLRLFTHGYNIFYTENLPLYHYYGTKNRHTPWSDEQSKIVTQQNKWYLLEKSSKERYNKFIAYHDLGIYSLGKVRSLGNYMQVSGIDFYNKTLRYQNHIDNPLFTLDYREKIEILFS